MRRDIWSRDELLLVFNLYQKMPFGKMYRNHPLVLELASLMPKRNENAVALRLVNFAACDPILQQRGIKGMQGGVGVCQKIWDEYFEDPEKLIYESEQVLANYKQSEIEELHKSILEDISELTGEDKVREVKTRVNQSIFRQRIITNYDNKCALTGINEPALLLASHIIPWSINKKERLNPTNGICLSALYDKAFDNGLIGFDSQYKLILSNKLKQYHSENYYEKFFGSYENQKLIFPDKSYKPNTQFLEWHMDEIFQR